MSHQDNGRDSARPNAPQHFRSSDVKCPLNEDKRRTTSAPRPAPRPRRSAGLRLRRTTPSGWGSRAHHRHAPNSPPLRTQEPQRQLPPCGTASPRLPEPPQALRHALAASQPLDMPRPTTLRLHIWRLVAGPFRGYAHPVTTSAPRTLCHQDAAPRILGGRAQARLSSFLAASTSTAPERKTSTRSPAGFDESTAVTEHSAGIATRNSGVQGQAPRGATQPCTPPIRSAGWPATGGASAPLHPATSSRTSSRSAARRCRRTA